MTSTVTSHPEALRLEALRKVYGTADNPVTALDGVTMALPSGTFTAVMGPSGSGKSTLLQCAAGLDRPTAGRVLIAGEPIPAGGEAAVTRFRRERVGFVFQQLNLLPTLTALENVTLPLRLAGRKIDRKHAATCWPGSGWAIGYTTGPARCPAASSSGWRSPGRWRPGRP